MRNWATLGLAVLIGAVAAGGLTYRFSIPALSDELFYRARTGWTLSVRTAESRLGILAGGRLSGLTARVAAPDFSLDVEADALLFPQVWIPGRALTVDRVQLVGSRLTVGVGGPLEPRAQPGLLRSEPVSETVDADSEEAPVPPPASIAGGSPWLVFQSPVIEMSEAALTVRSPDGVPILEASGLDARFTDLERRSADERVYTALSAAGIFHTDGFRAGRIHADETQGRIRIADGHVLVTEMTLICAETRLRLPDLDLDLLADPISVTTRSNPMRQVRSGPGTDPVWESLSSPADLADICQ